MMNKEQNFVSAVVYVHNAEERIKNFMDMLLALLEQQFEHSEIICVNDGSTDKSADAIRRLSDNVTTTSITLLNMSYFHGVEKAMNAGIDLAIGDFVFTFDRIMPDYEPEVIRNAYDMAVGGNDLVSVSAEQSTPFLSKCFYKVLAKYIPETGELQTDSFCILSRRLINRVSNMNRTVFFRKVLYNSSGLRTKRIIYSTQLRYNVGKEKSTRYKLQLGMDSIIAYTNFAFELSVSLTIFMMALVLIMMIYALIVKCTASPVPGWTSIILFVSFCFMGLFAILSIIIKYLQLAVGLLIKQKDYNFESIEKVTRQ